MMVCRIPRTTISESTVKFLLVFIGCWSLFAPVDAFALSSDSKQSLHVQADSARVDEREGSSTYKGSVSIEQGTLYISADQVHIVTRNKEVIKVVASSLKGSEKLAHYQQQPDDSEELVTADARQIIYHVKSEMLELKGNASLKQTENALFSAEILTYDIAKGVVNLDSSPDKQVIMTYKPEQ